MTTASARSTASAASAAPVVKWDDSRMISNYANVTNVAMTAEEVMLLFGTSQVWSSAQEEVTVQLTNRLIVTPSTARRLVALLTKSLADLDARNQTPAT